MHRIEADESRVERAKRNGGVRARPTWPRTFLAATLPPIVALSAQLSLGLTSSRWSIFYPAVYVSAWFGGLGSGIAATVLSFLLEWWFVIPPTHDLLKQAHPRSLVSAGIFVFMGFLISALQARLRQLNAETTAALEATQSANEELQAAMEATELSRDETEAANLRLAHATNELAENQRFLAAIMDYSPNGIVIKDLNGRYLKVNPRLEKIVGMSASDIVGKYDYEVFPREIAERFRKNDHIVAETREPLSTEERADLSDGSHIFLITKFPLLEHDGRVFAICAIWSDITDRKRVEDALRQTASDLREAQRIAHVGSWSWDPKTDAPRLSDELYRIFGRDPAEGVPKLFTEDSNIFTPESLAALRKGVAQVLSDGQPYELELEVVRPDGSRRWLAAHGDAVRDETGQIIEITGTAQDITELKKLQQLQKEWTSVIAHDLRQPIGVITSAADFLPQLHTGDMNDKEKDFAERIRASARMLARMVDDLLDLSLLEADRLKLERVWVDPSALVHETVERLEHMDHHHRIRIVEGPSLNRIYVDPMRIHQVLGNVISNAVKYGDPAGEIVVELKGWDHEVDIAVTNHGKGIEPDELRQIFTRFSRSKSVKGSGARGLGVGLYIAKGLIEAHGGHVGVESTPGETTTFHLTLPCGQAAQEAA